MVRTRRCRRARSGDGSLHDRVRASLRQRVPDPRRVPGARLPRRGARPVLLLVPLDDERPRRRRGPRARARRPAGARGVRRGPGRRPPRAAELPLRRRGQPGGDGHHLRAVPLGDRRRRDVDRGDHVVHRPDRRRRRRDDSRRDPQHVVPAAAAPRSAAGRDGRRGAVGPDVPGGAALRHADRRPPATAQLVRRRAARR